MSPQQWIDAAHSEAIIECHVLTGVQCAGAAIYRANVVKTPRSGNIIRLARDKDSVFATPQQFLEHHSKIKWR